MKRGFWITGCRPRAQLLKDSHRVGFTSVCGDDEAMNGVGPTRKRREAFCVALENRHAGGEGVDICRRRCRRKKNKPLGDLVCRDAAIRMRCEIARLRGEQW